jgi:alpha-glucosidase
MGFGRDPERTPMPWNGENGAGFTTSTPWLPIGPAAATANVALENRDPHSSLNLYRHLIHLRSESPGLRDGDYRSVEVGNGYVYAYVRETLLQKFLVVLNFDSKPASIELRGSSGRWVAGTHLVEGDGEPASGETTLEAYEGRLYELRKGEKI